MTMIRTVSRWHFTADARVHANSSSCGNIGGQIDTSTGSSAENRGNPVSTIQRMLCAIIPFVYHRYNLSKLTASFNKTHHSQTR